MIFAFAFAFSCLLLGNPLFETESTLELFIMYLYDLSTSNIVINNEYNFTTKHMKNLAYQSSAEGRVGCFT